MRHRPPIVSRLNPEFVFDNFVEGKSNQLARAAAPAVVGEIALFDVYTGDNIEAELKSLALSLILQESSHTLTDQEVDQATACVLDALASELSAKLRE